MERGGSSASGTDRRRPAWTVRLRLTALCGGVIAVSGGALVAITFLFGSDAKVNFVATTSGSRIPGVITIFGGSASGQGGTIINSLPTPGTGLSITQARIVAQAGSTTAVHALLIWSVIGLVLVTAIGLALGWLVSGRMLRPLRTMTDTTRRISEANLHQRLAIAGPRGDELKELGDTIDELLGRLERAFASQGRFVQNASHELRTPIAMIRTSLDVAEGKPDGVTEEVSALAEKVREGLDQAERLVEDFLVLSRAAQTTAADLAAVEIDAVVEDVIAARRAAADAASVAVRTVLVPAAVDGNETLLSRLVANLVDNGIAHNISGGWLAVTMERLGERVELVFENGGDALDPVLAAQLGEPFLRLGAARTGSERGVGLGLSIVRAIAEAHRGHVTFSARDGGGLRVVVDLPLSRRWQGPGARP